MRIVHIISSLNIGGAEKLLTEIAPIMKEKGHQVSVLTFDGSDTYFKQKLLHAGIDVVSLGVGKSVYNPLIAFQIRRYLQENDIAHAHLSSPQFFTAFANLFVNTHIVTTEHNTTNTRREKKLFRPLDKWMYRQYDYIISISDKTEEILRDYLGDNQIPIKTIYNGISVEKYSYATPLPEDIKNTSKRVITMVGAFRDQKDQKTLIRAFNHLDLSSFELWLVGDGENRSQIEAYIADKGMSDGIRLWGNRDDVPSILKSSDIIVLSSFWEGFGLAAVEGMAAGKPVIASNVDGLAQVVGGAGILFPVGDDQQLADHIIKLVEDPLLYSVVAHNCSKRAKQFDISHMVDGYLSVYEECLKKKHN